MAFLGYDRELLVNLRRSMRRASDALIAMTSTDPEAGDALHELRSSHRALDEQWLPVLDGLLACMALDERAPVQLDPTDLRLALVFDLQQHGWQVVLDPLVGSNADAPITVEEARAIGDRLLDDQADGLSSEELGWLAERLTAVAGNPAAAAAFRGAFASDADWAMVFDHLGLDRLDQADRATWDPDDAAAVDRMAALDAVFVPLAALYASGRHTSHAGPWFPTVIDHLDPYSAALLLRDLDLDSTTTARAADDVLLRWMTGHDDQRIWADRSAAGDNAADLLFGWLALDAEAARLFVVRATDHPEIIFLTAHDDASVVAVLMAGTDPSVMPVGEAGRTIRPLLDWSTQRDGAMNSAIDGGVDDPRRVLAPALAPWLMQLGPRADEWSWSPDQAGDALRWVIGDEQAAASLVASMDDWEQTLAKTPLVGADGRLDDEALHDLAGMFATLQVAFHDEEVADAVTAGFWSNSTVLFGAILVSAIVPGGPVISVLADVTLSAVSPAAQSWLHSNGMLRDPGDDIAAADARFGSRSADTAVVAVVGVVGRLIDAGSVPPDALDGLQLDRPDEFGDTCTPRVVDDRLHQFVQGLEGSTEPTVFADLVAVVNAFSNPLSIAQQC